MRVQCGEGIFSCLQHQWSYTGDGYEWRVPVGERPTWDHMVRRGHTQRECVTCGFVEQLANPRA